MFSVLFILMSCNSQEDSGEKVALVETMNELSPMNDCSFLTEVLDEHLIDDAVSIVPYQTAILFEGIISIKDESSNLAVQIGNHQHFDAVKLSDNITLFTLDGALYTFDGDWVVPSPLASLVPVPISNMLMSNNTVWLWGSGDLFIWNNDILRQVRINEGEEILDVVLDSSGKVYVRSPRLSILQDTSEGVESIENVDLLPISMSPLNNGNVWISEGNERLHRRDSTGTWEQFTILDSGSIHEIRGHNLASTLWIQGDNGSWVYENGQLCTLDGIEGSWLDVDELGRLLIQTTMGLKRVSTQRSVAVVGILNGGDLTVQKEIQFLPTSPDTLEYISVWIDEQELILEQEPYRTMINPEYLNIGGHELRIISQGSEGITVSLFPFTSGELPESSWQDVEVILDGKCISCHHEMALIPLHTKELWNIKIDDIIREVSDQSMPLGGPGLSNEDIITIRAWKQGGFR